MSGASAPEGLASVPAGILRDYMPDSNEKFVGKDIVRTAWRHAESDRNAHSTSFSLLLGDLGVLCGSSFFDRMGAEEMPDEMDGVTHLSEIPCRVSSDLHEWRNESATVLPTDTANL